MSLSLAVLWLPLAEGAKLRLRLVPEYSAWTVSATATGQGPTEPKALTGCRPGSTCQRQ